MDAAATATRPVPGPETHIDLYWLPLGAGDRFVRFNGRVYEWLVAHRDGRPRLDLYHTALEIGLDGNRFTIEVGPIMDTVGSIRGVAMQGPVGSRALGRLRLFRYELRCWRGGDIPDVGWAVDSPQRLSVDAQQARRLLELTAAVPNLVWGRDELGLGEMWNSNSVIAWLLAHAHVDTARASPPLHGRAPGWDAGLRLAFAQTGSEGHDATTLTIADPSGELGHPHRRRRRSSDRAVFGIMLEQLAIGPSWAPPSAWSWAPPRQVPSRRAGAGS
ncbi:MAG TPA: hypothetical protein VK875_10395 [Euzebyales bacterium]|nr:hypothetical protein [Euzebyales bacterium]